MYQYEHIFLFEKSEFGVYCIAKIKYSDACYSYTEGCNSGHSCICITLFLLLNY